MEPKTNKLYYGDNLVWLRDHDKFPDESVDLIYLDPPFNSNADYNVIFNEPNGAESQAQLRAFDDTWSWDNEASEQALAELSTNSQEIALYISWLSTRKDKASRSMAAYLGMMAVRLLELHRVLKPTGSIYLHCDPTASHYLRIIMDSIFGVECYRNELIWKRQSAHSDSRGYGSVHDTILFFVKSNQFTWNGTYQKYDNAYVEQYYRYKDENGRKFMSGDLGAAGLQGGGYEFEWKGIKRVWRVPVQTMERLEKEGRIFYTRNSIPRIKRYLDEAKGMPVQDVWNDIESLRSWHDERMGYPTQKPEALLERIVNASSNEGDTVFDPFCGCGTTIAAAQKLNRKWIGIDITYLSIFLVEKRLREAFGEAITETYAVYGSPYDVPSAQALWNKNKKEFEIWAVRLIGATPRKQDGGVDGVLGFLDEKRKTQPVVVQVKGGETLNPGIVRDLIGTVEKEKAAIGLLISLHEPTSGMAELAVHAGSYTSELWKKAYPRIQIRTIKDLLIDGKQFDLPPHFSSLKKAERIKEEIKTENML